MVYDIADVYRDILPLNYPKWLKEMAWNLEKFIINRADLIILPDVQRLPQITWSKPKKILFIYNTPEIPEKLSDIWIQEIDEFIWKRFCIAYFWSLNNQRFIIEMMNIVANWSKKEICMIIGWLWPNEQEVKEICDIHPDKLRFLWKVDYSQVLTISSRSQLLFAIYDPKIENNKFASPNKIFEAMALWKPILVSKGTTMVGYIEKYNMGYTVEYWDTKECIKKIQYLIEDDYLYNKFASSSQNSYTHFSAESMKQQLLESYNLLLK